MTHRRRPGARRLLLLLAAGALVAFGARTTWDLVVGPTVRAWDARGWVEATCRIEHVDVSPATRATRSPRLESRRYDVMVVYHVLTPDGEVRGDRRAFPSRQPHLGEAVEVRNTFAPGALVPCFHDPADPRRSVLDRRPGVTLGALFFPVVLAIGLLLIPVAVTPWPRRAPAPAPLPTGGARLRRRGRPPTAALVVAALALAWCLLAAALFVLEPGIVAIAVAAPGAALAAYATYLGGAASTWVEATIDRVAVRPGEPVLVRWLVHAPRRARVVGVELVGREVIDPVATGELPGHERTIVRRRVEGSGEAVVEVPPGAIGSYAGGPYGVDWRLRVVARVPWRPELQVELPLVVAPAADAPGEGDAPNGGDDAHDGDDHGGAPEGPVRLDGGRVRFAPGDWIAGELAWSRERAPGGAALRVCGTVSSPHAESHRVVAAELDAAELPRVGPPSEVGAPYRGAPDGDRGPLAERERRRFRVAAPASPPSYQGELFRIDWALEVVVDGEVVQTVPIVIGPGRAAVTARKR